MKGKGHKGEEDKKVPFFPPPLWSFAMCTSGATLTYVWKGACSFRNAHVHWPLHAFPRGFQALSGLFIMESILFLLLCDTFGSPKYLDDPACTQKVCKIRSNHGGTGRKSFLKEGGGSSGGGVLQGCWYTALCSGWSGRRHRGRATHTRKWGMRSG